MRLFRSCVIAITMIGAVALAQVTPGTEGRPIQGRSPAPPPPGPLMDLVKPGVDAYNKGDISYFDLGGFRFSIDDGLHKRIGTHTTLFRKFGNDWKVVLMHDSINAPAVPH